MIPDRLRLNIPNLDDGDDPKRRAENMRAFDRWGNALPGPFIVDYQRATRVNTVFTLYPPANLTYLKLIMSLRGSVALTYGAVLLRFNNSDSGNYDRVISGYVDGTGTIGLVDLAGTALNIADAPGTSATAGNFGPSTTEVFDYSAPDKYKALTIVSGVSDYAHRLVNLQIGSNWTKNEPITRIDVCFNAWGTGYEPGSSITMIAGGL